MNTGELIERVAVEHGVAKEHVRRILDSVFATVVSAVENGEDVALSGFGRFKLSNRAARQGRNPATGETLEIPRVEAARLHRRQICPRRSQRQVGEASVGKAKASVDA